MKQENIKNSKREFIITCYIFLVVIVGMLVYSETNIALLEVKDNINFILGKAVPWFYAAGVALSSRGLLKKYD